MTVRITKFNALKGALIVSSIVFLVTLLVALFFGLFRMVSGAPDLFTSDSVFTTLFVFVPAIAWGVGTFLTVFVCLWIYNKISHTVGYIEFDIDKSDL